MSTQTNTASEQIANLQAQIEASRRQMEEGQRQIEALKQNALQELKDKLAASQALTLELKAQIAAMSGRKERKAPAASGKKRARKASVAVTIEQIVEAIRGGAYNYSMLAAKLGASGAAITKKVKAEGAAAGITSTGEKWSFRLSA